MPKPGFKSITISETVYEKFHDVYEKNKDKLTMKGVNSFAGYITYMLEDTMQKDKTFAKYAPKLELVSIEDDRVIIKNNIAEVSLGEDEPGISPGQACVFYKKNQIGDKVLGGGWITRTANKYLST